MEQFSLCRVYGCWDSLLLHVKLASTKSLPYNGCVMSQTTQNKALRKGVRFNDCLSCCYAQHIQNLKFSNFRNKSYKIWKNIESRKIREFKLVLEEQMTAAPYIYNILIKHQPVTHCIYRFDSKNKWVTKSGTMPATNTLAGVALSIESEDIR